MGTFEGFRVAYHTAFRLADGTHRQDDMAVYWITINDDLLPGRVQRVLYEEQGHLLRVELQLISVCYLQLGHEPVWRLVSE